MSCRKKTDCEHSSGNQCIQRKRINATEDAQTQQPHPVNVQTPAQTSGNFAKNPPPCLVKKTPSDRQHPAHHPGVAPMHGKVGSGEQPANTIQHGPAHDPLPDSSFVLKSTITGCPDDRHGCTWSGMPRFADEAEWRPVSSCRDMNEVVQSLLEIAMEVQMCSKRTKSAAKKPASSEECLSLSAATSKSDRVRIVNKLRNEATKLQAIADSVHECVSTHVCAAMRASRSPELTGFGVLLDPCGSRSDCNPLGPAISASIPFSTTNSQDADGKDEGDRLNRRRRRPRTQKRKVVAPPLPVGNPDPPMFDDHDDSSSIMSTADAITEKL